MFWNSEKRIEELEFKVAELSFQLNNKPRFEIGETYQHGTCKKVEVIRGTYKFGGGYKFTEFGYKYTFDLNDDTCVIEDFGKFKKQTINFR